MVQDQLVEYISSQIKLGIARDAIKASLVGAGWQAADVEDTLKKVEASKAAGPAAASPMSSVSPIGGAAAKPASSPAAAKPGDSQMIRVSDLISTPDTAPASAPMSSKVFPKTASPAAAASSAASAVQPKAKEPSFARPMEPEPAHTGGSMLWKIIAIAAIVVFGGAAGYFYMQNSSLAGKVASLGTTSAGVSAQLSSLTAQVNALNASNTALAASNAALTAQQTELMLELSFYAVPPGGATSSIGPVMVAGILTGGGKVPYLLTTNNGAKIYVANSKDAKVMAALTPVVGTSTQISGTYFEGSQNITVTAVNGTPVAK